MHVETKQNNEIPCDAHFNFIDKTSAMIDQNNKQTKRSNSKTTIYDRWSTFFFYTTSHDIYKGMSGISLQNIERGSKSRDLNYSNKSFQAQPDQGLPLIQRQGLVW